MKLIKTFGEINTNNPLPYQCCVSINSKPVLTGFGITLSKKYYVWFSGAASSSGIAFSESNKTRSDFF
jgi:hypothetical protein